jgi:hypothetical protein
MLTENFSVIVASVGDAGQHCESGLLYGFADKDQVSF